MNTQGAKRTIVISMSVVAVVVWAGHGADTHAQPSGLVAVAVVAVLLSLLAEFAPQVAGPLAIVALIAAFLDNGAGFTKALQNLTKGGATHG